MNGNDLNNSSSSRPETYRATTNLNIDLENPQINMNSVVGVNIKDVDNTPKPNDRFSENTDIGNYASFTSPGTSIGNMNDAIPQSGMPNFDSSIQGMGQTNFESGSNQFVPNISNNESFQESSLNTTPSPSERVVYEPTMEEKKQKSSGFSVPKELTLTIFIVFILVIFILLMPYIYDFFRNLQMAMTG